VGPAAHPPLQRASASCASTATPCLASYEPDP
jgi:hypothetical protein